jgi:signal transduction histidine kinase
MPLTPHPRTAEVAGDPDAARPAVALSPALREGLLDPPAWREGLEEYARAMRLAVALVGADGRLLGPCLNPQPLWRLLRARAPVGAGGCPFALTPLRPCACVADALRTGVVARARDRIGLVHFAVPLVLGSEPLGALVAGQVFNQFPEQLPLEHVANTLGLPPAKVWEKARREYPVSPSVLRVYEDLLATLGQTFLQSRYHTLLEASRLAELRRAQEALRQANDELERRVEERTAALEEAQRRALRLERLAAIGEMAAGLAHDSRNIIQRSQACLDRLAWALDGNEQALDLVRRARTAQDELLRLYEDVREYAAPVRLERGRCELPGVWREAWEHLLAVAPNRDARLTEEVAVADTACTADRFRLGRVFHNLLDNALAACADPVRVRVACADADLGGRPALRVAVRDNGPGLTPEQRRRLFEPFYTTKTRGSGLGLAIARRIVEAHGGQIVASESGGPGAEILVTLPRSLP